MYMLRKKIFDSYTPGSLAWKMRQKRFEVFKKWLSGFPRPLKILDAGGTLEFWKSMGYGNPEDLHIVLFNLEAAKVDSPSFTGMAGDVTNMSQFKDQEFDIVFSNSVIEHVGDYDQQRKMAQEIKRVGKSYFIQTPNLFFPIEAHTCYPLFQFMPTAIQALLLYYFDLSGGGIGRTVETWKKRLLFQRFERLPCESWEKCLFRVRSLRLLSEGKFRALFPEGTIFREKFFGLTKSLVLYTNFPYNRESMLEEVGHEKVCC